MGARGSAALSWLGAGRRTAFFVLLAALVLAVSAVPYGLVRPLLDGTATASARLMAVVGLHPRVAGNAVVLSSRTLLITRDCTGAYLAAVFAALVLAFPATGRARLAGLVAGIPVLLVLNLARLVAAGWVAQAYPSRFEMVHDYAFQVVLMLAVLALWLVWAGKARTRVA